MNLYVLDTDTVSLHQRDDPKIDYNILTHLFQDEVATTIITVEEQWTGWLTQLRRVKTPQLLSEVYQQMTELMRYYGLFRLFSFNESAIRRFDSLKKMKLGVAAMDLRIAAIALEHGAIVVTRNAQDFGRVPGLTIEDWSK